MYTQWLDNHTLYKVFPWNFQCPPGTIHSYYNVVDSISYAALKCCYVFKDCIYLFLERGKEGETEEKKHQCVVASHTLPTGDLAHNSGVCPDWELNWQPFDLQASTQSTEPHQSGLKCCYFLTLVEESPSSYDIESDIRENFVEHELIKRKLWLGFSVSICQKNGKLKYLLIWLIFSGSVKE